MLLPFRRPHVPNSQSVPQALAPNVMSRRLTRHVKDGGRAPKETGTNVNETFSITGLSHGSRAIARSQSGKVAFVAGAFPGDVVEAEITKEAASYVEARTIKILDASPLREKPCCPHAGICGGCPWMGLSYEAQLEAKRADVVNQLARAGGMGKEVAEALVEPAVGSKRQMGYRNKLELAAFQDTRGHFQLGFHEQASSNLAAPKTCPVAARGIEKAPGALRGALSFLSRSGDLGIFRVGVRHSLRTKDTEIALWTKPGPFPRAQVAKTLGDALRCTSIVRVMADPGKARKVKGVERLSGKGCWEEQLGDFKYLISAPSFFQVNTAQAEKMIKLVIDGLDLGEDDVVADLYCGAGTFTLPLADYADMVFAVESAASSVRDLRRNLETNGTWAEVIGGDSARELPQLGHLDALVVDPPRAGLAKGVAESIAEAGPEKLAYVSCDPATWARDIARLSNVGYELVKATPVDLFPQTYHIETVSILKRVR